MIRLLTVELTRLRWRRAVLLLLAASVVVPVVVMAVTLWDGRPVGEAELRQAERIAAEQREDPAYQRDIRRCEKRPDEYGVGDTAECEEMMSPKAEWFLPRAPLQPEALLRDQGPAIGIVGAVLLLLTAATYAGHDWASGSMSNQVLFEPRRLRVWSAKAAAVTLAAGVVHLVAHAIFWAGIYLAARAWDIDLLTLPGRLDGLVLRSTVLVMVAALVGFALTMVFRSTVATLGILFAVAVAGTIVISFLPLDDNQRWLPNVNLLAWLQHGTDYYSSGEMTCVYDEESGAETCTGDAVKHLSLWGAARYLGTIAVVSVAASIPSFLRRDIP